MTSSAQNILSGIALVFLGAALFAMIWVSVPPANHDFIVFILGALSGAATVGGVGKIANTVASAASVQPDTQP